MTENKLQSLFNFLAVMSKICDTGGLMKQSQDYIESKFIQYLNEFNKFEFPDIDSTITEEEYKFLNEYEELWRCTNSRELNNIILFLYRIGWDVGVLPSSQLKMFKKCIGDYNLIKEPFDKYGGIHQVLICDFFEKSIYNNTYRVLNNDLKELYREFKIDSIINN